MLGATSEADLQQAVMELAQQCGWRSAHFRPARVGTSWATPVAGDGAGFPDLVLARGDRLLFVELKSMRGRLSPEQRAWRDVLTATGAAWHLWRPVDWLTIVQALR